MPVVPSEDQVQKSIASWLREYMQNTVWTQTKVAEDIGISGAQLSNILSGGEMPGFKTVIGIMFGLGADLGKVLRWKHDQVALLNTEARPISQTNGSRKRSNK